MKNSADLMKHWQQLKDSRREGDYMYLKDKNVLVAAIDHGFCTCKTPHVVFENGIQAFGVAPAFTEKTMRYKGNYYKVGEGRLPMKNVKTEDEDYFLLTLAGIAYEMDYYGLRYADVVVAAGLPFARFGAEKQAFTDYLKRGREDFEFNGKRYHINIVNVMLFPQCYAAVADRLGNMKADQLVVDIGSKTIDVIHTRNHVPVERDSFSLPEALISCTRRVEKAIYSQLNRKVSEANIQEAMMTGTSSLGEEYTKVMQEQIHIFAEELEAQLKENGFDPELTPIIYAGGGAAVMKLFGNIRGSHICYLEDVKANAIGYEYFAVKKLQKQVIS